MKFTALPLLASFLLYLSFSATAYAQEDNTQAEKATAAQEALSQNEDYVRRKAAEHAGGLLDALVENLEAREKNHLYIIYTNYNMIATVTTVRTDVQNAIVQCSLNNTEMQADLDARFAQWDSAIATVMKEARGNLNNMVLAQDYAPKAKIDELFAAVDTVRSYNNSQIEKIPVTTPEACTYLLNKMDETQETMIQLLRNTLTLYPRTFQKAPEEVLPNNQPEPKRGAEVY